MWKSQPRRQNLFWSGHMEPAPGESCLIGHRRDPAAPGDDNVSSSDQKSLRISTNPSTRGQEPTPPGSIPPRKVKSRPHQLIADLGATHGAGARGELLLGTTSRLRRTRGFIRYDVRIRNPSVHLQLQQLEDQDGHPPGRCRPARLSPASIG